jgi:hypothetical protein
LGEGCEDEHLSCRYARVARQPIDLTGNDTVVECRAELMLEVEKLMRLVQREFLLADES